MIASDGGAIRAPAVELDFRRLAQIAPDPMAVHEAGRLVWANDAAAALVGARSPGELVGRPMMDFVAPEDRDRTLARIRELYALGGVQGAHVQTFQRLDGKRIEVETTGVSLGGDRVLVIVRDVSARNEAERGRLTAEARVAAIFDTAAEPMALTIDGRFELVNAAFLRLFGFARREEAIGLSVADLVPPEEAERLRERHRRRISGEPLEASYTARAIRRDGTPFDVEVHTSGRREGDRLATISVMRDVTERNRLERQLRASEQRFRELFEFVPVSLWEVDGSAIRAAVDRLRAAGVTDLRAHVASHPEALAGMVGAFRTVAVNAFGCALAGARTQEELLAHLDRVHVPDSFPRYRELGLQLLEGRAVAHAEGWSGTLDGGRTWLDTAATLVPGHEATWGRMLFASVDVTERRRAEEERAALGERLRQAEKLEAIGRLAGGIAHDFNNILSGILGYTELSLLAVPQGTDVHDHQERIREAALRARDLVRQILAFSRRDRTFQRTVDVPHVVREALALMRAGIPSSVALEVRIDPDAGLAHVDPTQLHQIVLNLCANARDAVGSYGRISVEVEAVQVAADRPEPKPGRYVRLRVRDDGAGMDEATRAHLFEPYMTTKGRHGGHGLGLAVVHGIVTGAGGAILVETAPGLGSTFDVYLPRAEESEGASVAAAQRPAGRGERILVVDDEPMVRDAHRRLLQSLGYTVEVAADGEQALARFRDAPEAFDLVMTDQAMPRLSGVDLARRILELRPGARVILCTGYADQVDDAAAQAMGLRSLLPKPIDHATMAAAVRRALDDG